MRKMTLAILVAGVAGCGPIAGTTDDDAGNGADAAVVGQDGGTGGDGGAAPDAGVADPYANCTEPQWSEFQVTYVCGGLCHPTALNDAGVGCTCRKRAANADGTCDSCWTCALGNKCGILICGTQDRHAAETACVAQPESACVR